MIDLEIRAGEGRAYIESLPPSMREEGERIYTEWRNGLPEARGLNPDGSWRFPRMVSTLREILRGERRFV